MAMFKKIAGKAKPVSKKDAEKMIKVNRQNRVAPTEEKEDEQPTGPANKPK